MSALLHDEINAACGTNVGIGLRVAFINGLLTTALARLGKVPLSFPVPNRPIEFTVRPGKVDPPHSDLKAQELVFPSTNVEIDVHLAKDKTALFVTLVFDFADIRAKVGSTSFGQLQLFVSSHAYPRVGVKNEDFQLIDKHFKDRRDYERFIYMLEVNAASSIPSDLCKSISFPPIMSVVTAIRLLPPFEITFINDYLVMHGREVDITPSGADCHKGPDARSELSRSSPTVKEQAVHVPNSPSIDRYSYQTVIIHSPTFSPPVKPWGGSPDLILYLPKPALLDLSFAILKPSVSATGGGSAIAYYEYFATAALSSVKVPEIDLDPKQLKVLVNSSSDIFGHASAGIEILCIKIELIGVWIKGTADPVNVALIAYLEGGQLVLYSIAEKVTVDLDMSGSFPLGMVASWIFEDSVENTAYKKISDILNSFRVTLLDLTKIGIKVGKHWSAIQSTRMDSVLLGAVDFGDADSKANP